MSATDAVLVLDARAELGESPLWDERTATLVFADILAGTIVRFDPASGDAHVVATFDEPVPSLALTDDGGLVAAVGTSIRRLDGDNSSVLAELADAGGVRFNDGACDPQGRYWIGTMAFDEAPGRGSLYRCDGGELVEVVPGVTISNGLDWSGDGTRMYYVDSPTRRVDVFDFDGADGTLSARRSLVEIDAGDAVPDGLTVDAEDHLWVALWDGWAVHRYAPDGTLDRVVELPVARPTSCAFGGPDLRDLYVTSARTGLSADELARQPHAGGVFRVRPGVPGRLPNRFTGTASLTA